MNLNKRQQEILESLEKENYVSVQQLSQELNVSSVTIRKDLNSLENKGLLYRTHGGASKRSLYAYEQNIRDKEKINVNEKRLIAEKSLEFIHDNDFIILASGTTIHHLAKLLFHFQNLTVLTPSLGVALELCKSPHINIIQLGGEVRKSAASVVGSISETILSQFSCNTLFLGVDGFDVNFGISTSNASEAHINAKMIDSASKVIVLADSHKINKRGFGKIAELKDIDYLITDDKISTKDKKSITEAGVTVIISN